MNMLSVLHIHINGLTASSNIKCPKVYYLLLQARSTKDDKSIFTHFTLPMQATATSRLANYDIVWIQI